MEVMLEDKTTGLIVCENKFSIKKSKVFQSSANLKVYKKRVKKTVRHRRITDFRFFRFGRSCNFSLVNRFQFSCLPLFVIYFFILFIQRSSCQPRPRFYLGNGKLEMLRQKVADNELPYWLMMASIRSVPRKYDPVVCPADFKSDSIIPYSLYPAIALSYLILEDVLYFDLLKDWIDCALSISWDIDDPQKAMYHSQLLYGFSLVFDWLYDEFTPAERATLAGRMMDLALQYDECFVKSSGWCMYYLHNLFSWKAAGLSSVTLALRGEPGIDQNVLDNIAQHLYDAYTKLLNYSMVDGTSMEGMGYYSNVFLGANIRHFYVEEILFQEDRVIANDYNRELFTKIGIFLLYAISPTFSKWGVEYSDSGSGAFNERYLLGWLANKVSMMSGPGTPPSEYAGYFRFAEEMRLNASKEYYGSYYASYLTLVLYPDSLHVQPQSYFDVLALEYLFDDFGVYISKERWFDAKDSEGSNMLFFKSGPPTGHHLEDLFGPGHDFATLCHEHPDQGQFHFTYNGRNLFVEDRYVTLKKTASHNAVTFTAERVGQYGENEPGGWCFVKKGLVAEQGTSEMIHTDIDYRANKYEYLVANLTRIYPLHLNVTKYLRHFVYVMKKYILVFDEIEFSENNSTNTADEPILVEQHFHSDREGTILMGDGDGKGKNVIYLHPDGDIGYKLFDMSDRGVVKHENYTLLSLYNFYSRLVTVEVRVEQSRLNTIFQTVIIPFKCQDRWGNATSCGELLEDEEEWKEFEPQIKWKKSKDEYTHKIKFDDVKVSVYLKEFRIEINEKDAKKTEAPATLEAVLAAISTGILFGIILVVAVIGLVFLSFRKPRSVKVDSSVKEAEADDEK